MNKLVSKNPVLRFKEGKKIEKFYGGGGLLEKFFRYVKNREANPNKPQAWGYSYLNKLNNTSSLQSTYKTPELKGSKEAYLNRLKLLGFTAKPTKPIVKKQSVVPRSGWSYGFDRSSEISDIKAVQDMLRNGGFYAKGANSRSDGAWGKDTELAYLNYLKSKLLQSAPALPSTTDLILHITSLVNFNQPNKSSAPFIYDLLQMAKELTEKPSNIQYKPQEVPELFLAMLTGKYKKGGQLPFRNPILRFKSNFR